LTIQNAVHSTGRQVQCSAHAFSDDASPINLPPFDRQGEWKPFFSPAAFEILRFIKAFRHGVASTLFSPFHSFWRA